MTNIICWFSTYIKRVLKHKHELGHYHMVICVGLKSIMVMVNQASGISRPLRPRSRTYQKFVGGTSMRQSLKMLVSLDIISIEHVTCDMGQI